MDIVVPLNRLKFGHEDGEGINARVVGREDGIAALAANIFANRSDDNPTGLIENLIVKEAGEGFYAFAIENVPPTGWLPLQLRARGYDGPPVKKGKLTSEKGKPAGGRRQSGKVVAKKAAKKAVKKKR